MSEITLSRTFENQFAALSNDIREEAYKKLELYFSNPAHPSLRVKKMSGTRHIWEMSLSMNYRITFEKKPGGLFLRKIGTHDILERP
jgi:mRNA interferase RelE/StbE